LREIGAVVAAAKMREAIGKLRQAQGRDGGTERPASPYFSRAFGNGRFRIAEVSVWGGFEPDGVRRCRHSAGMMGWQRFLGAGDGFCPKSGGFRPRLSLLP